MNRWQVIHGDVVDVLKGLDIVVDCVFTDPPYMISKEMVISRSKNCKFKGKDIKLHFGKWDEFKDLGEYLDFTDRWVKECSRLLRKGGHFISFFDKFKVSYLIEIGNKYGLLPRQTLYWCKTNPLPQVRKVKFQTSLEMMVWFTKETTSRRYAVFNYELGQHTEVFEAPIPCGKDRKLYPHPCFKPVSVVIQVLRYLTKEGELVLDPFCGSGSVGVACLRLGRRYIGIERDDKYYELAVKRLTEEEARWCLVGS